MTRVHVCGAAGYAALEMISILAAHPCVELGALESASHSGESVGSHDPRLRRLARAFNSPGAVLRSAAAGDLAVLGGSSASAQSIVPPLLAAGVRVLDLSGEFRLQPSPAIYGFAERYRAAIAKAAFVANPGCYPTATLLATLPLARLQPLHIIVDAKSGVSGAGRTPSIATHFVEVSGEIRCYGLRGHRHEAEILQEWHAADIAASLVFTPHVVPIARGMLVDTYSVFSNPPDPLIVRSAYEEAYAQHPSVRLLETDAVPSIRAVVGTNDAELHVSVRGNIVRSICAIDNLGRGAATQALTSLNLMYGYPEEMGLPLALRS